MATRTPASEGKREQVDAVDDDKALDAEAAPWAKMPERELKKIGYSEPLIMAAVMLSQIGFGSVVIIATLSRIFSVQKGLAAFALYAARAKLSKTQNRGGRPVPAFQKAAFWKAHASYFSAQLIKTAEVPPESGPYVLACHPHGVLALAMPPNFASDGSGFFSKFPGLDLRVAVANLPFMLPLAREIALSSGCIAADRDAIEYSLSKGQSVAIVVGGPDEALLAGTGKMRLVLKDRVGFVKTAVAQGANIVPVITYGENQAFTQMFPSFIKRMQITLVKKVGISLPLFYGCGFFGTPTPLPERVRLISVVGAPLMLNGRTCDPKKEPERFEQFVREVHAEYIERVVALHAATHEEYGSQYDHELEIITVQEGRDFYFKAGADSQVPSAGAIQSRL